MEALHGDPSGGIEIHHQTASDMGHRYHLQRRLQSNEQSLRSSRFLHGHHDQQLRDPTSITQHIRYPQCNFLGPDLRPDDCTLCPEIHRPQIRNHPASTNGNRISNFDLRNGISWCFGSNQARDCAQKQLLRLRTHTHVDFLAGSAVFLDWVCGGVHIHRTIGVFL